MPVFLNVSETLQDWPRFKACGTTRETNWELLLKARGLDPEILTSAKTMENTAKIKLIKIVEIK